jgi:hypothetical protein
MDQGRLERLLNALHNIPGRGSVLYRICVVGVDGDLGSGAGVARIAGGRHDLLAASNTLAAGAEGLQITLAEGPCLEAVRSLRPAFAADLSSGGALERWPRFARAALDQGVAAAFAFPLMVGGVATGALDLYARAVGELDDGQVEDALILADLAALAVDRLGGDADVDGIELAVEPAEPWAYAAVVHNASGMVAAQLGITVDEALLRLRAVAFATERGVADVADDIVGRRLRLDDWPDDE